MANCSLLTTLIHGFTSLFPAEHAAVSSCRVWTYKIHRVRASRSGTLAKIAVVLQRVEHEVVVEIVLPKEHLCFFCIRGEAHITSQSFAIHFNVSAIHALQRHFPIALVDELELCELTLVAIMSVVEDAVRVTNGWTVGGFVDDAESRRKEYSTNGQHMAPPR